MDKLLLLTNGRSIWQIVVCQCCMSKQDRKSVNHLLLIANSDGIFGC